MDIPALGDMDDLRINLVAIASRLQSVGKCLALRTDIDIGCRVYPAIADSTARQLGLLARMLEEPIEIAAGICRTVFEINIALRYCLSSPQRLDNYSIQAATDEISIYQSIIDLRDHDASETSLESLRDHIEQIKATLVKHGKSLKAVRAPWLQMAKDVGYEQEYQAFYGLYSKYVHASAWFVLRNRDHIDLPTYRFTMEINAQGYAADTLARLEEVNIARR
jgi:hypothetical protein